MTPISSLHFHCINTYLVQQTQGGNTARCLIQPSTGSQGPSFPPHSRRPADQVDEAELTPEPGSFRSPRKTCWADGGGVGKKRLPGLQSCSGNDQPGVPLSIYDFRETGGRGSNLLHIERHQRVGELSRMMCSPLCVCAPPRAKGQELFFSDSQRSPTRKKKKVPLFRVISGVFSISDLLDF